MKKLSLLDLIFQSLIGATYVVLVLLLPALAYGQLQFRIAEALLILIFFSRKNMIGLLLGTFIANFLGDFGIIDAVFGTLATFIALSLMSYIKMHVAFRLIWPVIVNAIYVGLLLMFMVDTPFLITGIYVGISEALVVYGLGLPLYYSLNKNQTFKSLFQ